MNIADLVDAWRMDPSQNTLAIPASDLTLGQVEGELGFRFPSELHDFYKLCNGGDLLDGNLHLYPLADSDTQHGLVSVTSRYRGWGWLIPEEVALFGDNGSDEVFGVWLDRSLDERSTAPVVEIGEIFEPDCMALVGTSIVRFLAGWTAYYTLLYGRNEAVLDRIGLPESLRLAGEDMDDESFAAIRGWADKTLVNPNPSPYRDRLDQAGLRAKLGLV